MIIKNLSLCALAAFALGACSGDKGDSGDTSTATTTTGVTTGTTTTSTYTGPTLIDMVSYPGCADDTTWVYGAETVGWTDGNNIVNAWETGNAMGWNEEHSLPSVEFGANNTWDRLEQSVTDEAAVADYAPDTNTVFACGTHDVDPVMTYAIRVYDFDGNYADCAIFATDTAGIDAVYDGSAPNLNPVTAMTEVDAANCTEWNVSR